MNNKERNKKLFIDAQLAELEKGEEKIKKELQEKDCAGRVKKDQTKEAMETLKEVVAEFLEIEDLKAFRDKDTQLYKNKILTIVSWFDYLKIEKKKVQNMKKLKV